MVSIYFDPAVVHRNFWTAVDETLLSGGLIKNDILREKISIQLLHCALEEIFLSIPFKPDAQFEDHLETIIDREKMIALLLAHHCIDEPEMIECKLSLVSHSDLGTIPIGENTCKKAIYPSNRSLAATAFSTIYQRFVDSIEKDIRGCCQSSKRSFNRYYNVVVEPKIDGIGKIVAIEIQLSGDVRHDYFQQQFPNGRYKVCN